LPRCITGRGNGEKSSALQKAIKMCDCRAMALPRDAVMVYGCAPTIDKAPKACRDLSESPGTL
jgi:hypothetical protein